MSLIKEPIENISIEELRNNYKPFEVKTLFIGESVPADEKAFFYCENSNLYKQTKAAFNSVFGRGFDSKKFQDLGCWLYDVCDDIPQLIKTIEDLKPKTIVALKRDEFRRALISPLKEIGFIEDKNVFYLPYPSLGNNMRYSSQLSAIIRNYIRK